MDILISLLVFILDVYLWLIILTVVVSWLVAFDVLNTRNKWIFKGCALLNAATDPVVRQVRRFIPPLGGVDITPMVIIFGIYILQAMLLGLR